MLACMGCPKEKTASPAAADNAAAPSALVQERKAADGNLIQEVDLDGDSKPEVYNYFRNADDRSRVLLRKESDLNHDGKIDVSCFFTETGTIDREEMDSDFDGKVDWIDHYQAGKRVSTEVDSDQNGKFDVSKSFEAGRIKSIERDTNGDSKTDLWQYFDDSGNVIKVGWDIDGDGQMDVRQE